MKTVTIWRQSTFNDWYTSPAANTSASPHPVTHTNTHTHKHKHTCLQAWDSNPDSREHPAALPTLPGSLDPGHRELHWKTNFEKKKQKKKRRRIMRRWRRRRNKKKRMRITRRRRKKRIMRRRKRRRRGWGKNYKLLNYQKNCHATMLSC